MSEFTPIRQVKPVELLEQFEDECGEDEDVVTLPLKDFETMERFQAWLVEALAEAKVLLEEATAHPKKARDGVAWRHARLKFIHRVRPVFEASEPETKA